MQVQGRTIYMSFKGFCTHCGNAVEGGAHCDGECNMEGAEVRLKLLGIAFEEWLKVERAGRLAKAAREYLEYVDYDTKKELSEAIEWFERGPGKAEGEQR
jgi:hypothetical protein